MGRYSRASWPSPRQGEGRTPSSNALHSSEKLSIFQVACGAGTPGDVEPREMGYPDLEPGQWACAEAMAKQTCLLSHCPFLGPPFLGRLHLVPEHCGWLSPGFRAEQVQACLWGGFGSSPRRVLFWNAASAPHVVCTHFHACVLCPDRGTVPGFSSIFLK